MRANFGAEIFSTEKRAKFSQSYYLGYPQHWLAALPATWPARRVAIGLVVSSGQVRRVNYSGPAVRKLNRRVRGRYFKPRFLAYVVAGLAPIDFLIWVGTLRARVQLRCESDNPRAAGNGLAAVLFDEARNGELFFPCRYRQR